MSDIAIQVENISKRYRIGVQETQHETIAGTVLAWVKSPLDNFRRLKNLSQFGEEDSGDVLWALRDVSFSVKQGEVIGIIGHNGAGKSTLLKILSRITPPSQGRITLYGRVASLLEVGTGFHPELTGRENIYLNGTILGMRKSEIDRKFDEIVDFSGVEQFIDTPVKRYSSGMRVRLAFSVAAHLEPEILLVDEVLAVGDAEFQRKSLGKMQDVANDGRAILFVSHNMGAITRLTKECFWLNEGKIAQKGPTSEIISNYLESNRVHRTEEYNPVAATEPVQLLEASVSSTDGQRQGHFAFSESFQIHAAWKFFDSHVNLAFFVRIESSDGTIVTTLNSRDTDLSLDVNIGESVKVFWKGASNFLVPGRYYITLAIHDRLGQSFYVGRHLLKFEIAAAGAPMRLAEESAMRGLIHLPGTWSHDINSRAQ